MHLVVAEAARRARGPRPRVLVAGTPAKVVRELKAEEKEGLPRISSGYVERSRRFKLELREQQLPPSVR